LNDAAGAEVVYVALGSNVGDRESHLSAARAALALLPGTRIVGMSEVEETEPLGPAGQDRYLNQMLALRTELEPADLLRELQRIESARGRTRGDRWGPRTLDLDIVRYGARRIATDELTVPHPELPRRDFWQRELAQLESS
jgi:2-amino-4-hydroxy-6-hydroxymethyldihydropteridine diphosphokinase